MNKLLQQMTSRFHMIETANQDMIRSAPSFVAVDIKIDNDTWNYFQNMDEDARGAMANVLADYVERQK
jgi:hypothetical protein